MRASPGLESGRRGQIERMKLRIVPTIVAAKTMIIADLAVFLASPRGRYVNGTVVDVDGGGRFRA